MRIYRSSIRGGVPFHVSMEEGPFEKTEFEKTYPLLGIEKAYIDGDFEKNGDIVTFRGVISGTLLLADARTNETFPLEVSVDDVIDLLEDDEDENGEGYIFPGNGIEIHDLVYSVLRSETPIKPLKPGSELPKSGEGYSVYVEGEEGRKPSPFDVLADLDLD